MVIYVRAEDFRLTGTEAPSQINENKELIDRIKKLSGMVCQNMGLVNDWKDAKIKIPYSHF